ncbi:putative conserved membrane protein [Synechococcus sp. A18-40]|nr:putative conserved membrane protein [Synechococcus sp. A18-40]
MAHESEHRKVQAEPAQARRPRFWVGPLLVGCCFSLGYGITHRVVTLQANPEPPSQPEPFVRQEFPGQSLASLRRSSGGTGSLVVDVAAIEAKAEAERHEELVRKEELALRAPLPDPSWTAPEWTEPDQPFPEESQSVPAASIDPLLDPSVDPFNPIDPLLEVSTPEVTLDQNDFFVPIEPIPAPTP